MLLVLLLLVAACPATASVPGSGAAVDSSLGIFRFDSVERIPADQRDAVYAEYVQTVRASLEHRSYSEAQQLAARAIALWPQRQRPYLHLAQAEDGAQRWSPSIVAARKARKAAPDDLAPAVRPEESAAAADYWEGLGFYQTQRYEEAMPFLRAASDAAPDWAEAQRARGECAYLLQDIDDAASSYRRAFQLDAHAGGVRDLSYYADAIQAQGDLETGIAALESALERFPYEPGLHAKLATFYQHEDNVVEAYYHFILEQLVHGKRGDFSKKALDAANAIFAEVQANEDHPARHELLLVSTGMVDLESGRAHQALHSLDHVKRMTQSTTIVPYMLLADAQMHLGQLAEARDTLDEALSLHVEFVPAMVMLARTLRGLDENESAQEMVERAFELFPTYWKLQPENLRQRG